MAIVRSTLLAGQEPTPEQRAATKARLREAAKRPYTYDPDCPLLTEEQLAQFHPINGMTWEERAVLMEEAYQNGTLERPRPEDFLEEQPIEAMEKVLSNKD